VASQIKLAIVSGDVRDITKGNERVVNSCRSVSDKRRKPLEKPKEIQKKYQNQNPTQHRRGDHSQLHNCLAVKVNGHTVYGATIPYFHNPEYVD